MTLAQARAILNDIRSGTRDWPVALITRALYVTGDLA